MLAKTQQRIATLLLLMVAATSAVAADQVVVGSCYGARACSQPPSGPYGFPVRSTLNQPGPLTLAAGCQSFHAADTPGLFTIEVCDEEGCDGNCKTLKADEASDACYTPPARDGSVASLCLTWERKGGKQKIIMMRERD